MTCTMTPSMTEPSCPVLPTLSDGTRVPPPTHTTTTVAVPTATPTALPFTGADIFELLGVGMALVIASFVLRIKRWRS